MPLRIAWLLVPLLICGCVVDQDKEVATYREVIDPPLFTVTSQPADPQPLTLDDALRLANRNNENLAIQGETYLQAIIDRKRAVAAFLPTINLAPTYFFRDPPDSDTDFGGGARNTRALRLSARIKPESASVRLLRRPEPSALRDRRAF